MTQIKSSSENSAGRQKPQKNKTGSENDQFAQDKNIIINNLDAINYQLREPISSIFASLPALSESINNCDTEKANKSLQSLYEKAYLVLKNINNISLATKIFTAQKLLLSTVDISSLVESACASTKIILPDYVNIETDIQSDILIKGNSAILSHAIFNLILNSIEYRNEADVNIKISLKATKTKCLLRYSDNSLGIKDNVMPNIFDAYYTCDPYDDGELNTKLGLGLYIAKAAFENAGGKILASSEFGKGMSYAVSIPLCSETEENLVRSKASDFVMNRYSEMFVQLCEYCILPDLR